MAEYAAIVGIQMQKYEWHEAEKAKKEAKALKAKKIDVKKASVTETIRRREEKFKQTQAGARAKIGASGLSGASFDAYLAERRKVHEAEIAWMRKTGESDVSIMAADKGAEKAAEARQAAAVSSAVSTASGWWSSSSNN